MPHYIVIGRVEGDDDDSMKLIACDNHDIALDAFSEWIIKDYEGERTITEDDLIVSWIIKCETKPDILASPWGPV